jgi:hypothetical protein
MIKCENCGREAMPQKKFNILFFLMSLIFIPITIIYLIIYACKPANRCPYCKTNIYKKTINTKLMEAGNPMFLYLIYGMIAIFILAMVISIAKD